VIRLIGEDALAKQHDLAVGAKTSTFHLSFVM
jgi:hypothetical protein